MNYVSDFVFRQVCAIEPKTVKGSQKLIDKSILGVVIDNAKLIDLFSALYKDVSEQFSPPLNFHLKSTPTRYTVQFVLKIINQCANKHQYLGAEE